MITDERLSELIGFLEETKEKMPYEHIDDELACLKELKSLRVSTIGLIKQRNYAENHPLQDRVNAAVEEILDMRRFTTADRTRILYVLRKYDLIPPEEGE